MRCEILTYKEEYRPPEKPRADRNWEVVHDRPEAWRGQAVGIAPTERLKLRRQMAAAAGKKGSVSLSLLLEANDFDVEEELPTMATQAWAERVWIQQMFFKLRRGDK